MIFKPDGTHVSQSKLHITPSEKTWWGISGGDSLIVLQTPKAKIGVLICYDVEFPEAARYLALPALVLGLTGGAVLARFVRTSVSQVMNQDYIRTSRAKGLRERAVVIRHALRNGLVPVVTVMALQFAGLLTGSVVVESVFSRPGIGRLVVGAIQARDYPVVQGTLLLLVVVFITINLLADLMYGLLDPRIRVT